MQQTKIPFTDEEKANVNMLKITDGIVTGVTDHRKLLGTLVLPDGITEIGMFTFVGCSGLKSIIIPDSVTKIGTGAFTGCFGLTNIIIPDSVTEIADEVFYFCGLIHIAFKNVHANIHFTVKTDAVKALLKKSPTIRDEQITVEPNL